MSYSRSCSRSWNCIICDERHESMDLPRITVCEDCIRPVAEHLCYTTLGVKLATPGIDADYWQRQASNAVTPMLQRWQPVTDKDHTPRRYVEPATKPTSSDLYAP